MRGYPLLTLILGSGLSDIQRIRKVVDALFFLISSYEETL